MAPGSLGDPILISDSPPHVSENDADHHPRQGFAHSGSGLDNAHQRAAPLPASGLRPGHRDSTVDEYGRTVPRPISRPIIPPIPRPVPAQLTEQFKAPRGINPYLEGKATDRRLPLQTLPYNVKHSILQEMQKVLEGALFDWAKEWAPVMLKMAGWETAEAGELNWWWRTIESYSRRAGADHNARPISVDAFSRSAGMNMRELHQLLGRRLPHIRHAAVHRDPGITVSALKEMLADAHCLTKGLRDEPRTRKLYAMQLALEANDIKWMDAMMATPASEFTVDFDPKKFRTQPSTLEQENTRPGDLKRKRSESPAEKVSRHRAEAIKHSGQSMDLTKDSNDDDPPSSRPAQPTRVIDLTGEEVVVLFSSTRGSKELKQ